MSLKDLYHNSPVFLRIVFDSLAMITGVVGGLLFSSGDFLRNLLASMDGLWTVVALITIVATPTILVMKGAYSSRFSVRKRRQRNNFVLIVNTLVFVGALFVVLLFGGSLSTYGLALFLGWLLSSMLLSLGRLGYRLFELTYSKEIGAGYRPRVKTDKKTVLVTGGAGYIGSALVPRLLESGYNVRILDLMQFGDETIAQFADHPNLTLIREDYRNIETLTKSVQGARHLIHLGGLVGDPACSYDEELTTDINITSTKMLGEIAKAHGVERFLFASSCSVYGASDEVLDETSSFNPISLYAKSKIASERVLLEMMNEDFSPIFLRFGTIYGLSGRTRFDLVVNLLTAKAVVDKKITVFGGDQWRPFIHVDDAARGVFMALEAPLQKTAGEAFNIGSDEQNYTLWQMAEVIKEIVPDAELLELGQDGDRRDYRVTFSKAVKVLGFKPEWSLEAGIKQVLKALKSGKIENYTDSKYSNVKHLSEGGAKKYIRTYYTGWENEYIEKL